MLRVNRNDTENSWLSPASTSASAYSSGFPPRIKVIYSLIKNTYLLAAANYGTDRRSIFAGF